MNEDNYIKLIKDKWVPLNQLSLQSVTHQFMENLKKVKQVTIQWAKQKKLRDEEHLKSIEEGLDKMEESESRGYETKVKDQIRALKVRKRGILLDQEEQWRLKSGAVWLKSGDENSKFFHNFTRG